jgi:hypothetical protein
MSEVENGAVLSPCERYRYRLWRRWDNRPLVAFIMLNPSTADAALDDPTIRKCMGFARRWNYGGIDVGNLFALRATDPEVMRRDNAPIGSENIEHLRRICADASQDGAPIVCAWGAHGTHLSQAQNFIDMCRSWGVKLSALRFTKSGMPGHPLYIPYEAPLFEFP